MGHRGYIDNSSLWNFLQHSEKEVCEVERPEYIYHMCLMDPVRADLTAHHPGVVYEHIEVLKLLLNLRDQFENRLGVGKIEEDILNSTVGVGSRFPDVLHCLLVAFFAHAGYDQAVAISIESSCSLPANT